MPLFQQNCHFPKEFTVTKTTNIRCLGNFTESRAAFNDIKTVYHWVLFRYLEEFYMETISLRSLAIYNRMSFRFSSVMVMFAPEDLSTCFEVSISRSF